MRRKESPRIEIDRKNCVDGKWSIPGRNEPGTVNDVIEHYVSEKEGRDVSSDELSRLNFKFEPDDPKNKGKHGIDGTVTIDYDLR